MIRINFEHWFKRIYRWQGVLLSSVQLTRRQCWNPAGPYCPGRPCPPCRCRAWRCLCPGGACHWRCPCPPRPSPAAAATPPPSPAAPPARPEGTERHCKSGLWTTRSLGRSGSPSTVSIIVIWQLGMSNLDSLRIIFMIKIIIFIITTNLPN
jgi:hypothetical protein